VAAAARRVPARRLRTRLRAAADTLLPAGAAHGPEGALHRQPPGAGGRLCAAARRRLRRPGGSELRVRGTGCLPGVAGAVHKREFHAGLARWLGQIVLFGPVF
jgi:hypothetical protein